MRRYLGRAFIFIALLTIAIWLTSKFILPILPSYANSEFVLFLAIFLGVLGVLSQIKDVSELFGERQTTQTTTIQLNSNSDPFSNISPNNKYQWWGGAGDPTKLPLDFYRWFDANRLGTSEVIHYSAKRRIPLPSPKTIFTVLLVGCMVTLLGLYLYRKYDYRLILAAMILCDLFIVLWMFNSLRREEIEDIFLIVTTQSIAMVRKLDDGVYEYNWRIYYSDIIAIGFETDFMSRYFDYGNVFFKINYAVVVSSSGEEVRRLSHIRSRSSLDELSPQYEIKVEDVINPRAVQTITVQLWSRWRDAKEKGKQSLEEDNPSED